MTACVRHQAVFSRIFNRHRFENNELEWLFRRYILRVSLHPYYNDHPLCPRCPHPGACDDDCEQVQHASIRQAVALFVILTAALATVSFIKVIFCIFIYCQYIAVSFTKVTQSADSQTIYLHQPGIVSGRHPQTHKSKAL